jgi:hypothetical protein
VQTWWIRTRIDNSRVSVRSRIAYHLRAVDALLPQTFVRESKDMKNVQVLKWEIWEALSAAANLLDGAFDV